MSAERPVTPEVRTGQGSVQLTREEFARRYRRQFFDPAFEAFEAVDAEIERVVERAWNAYDEYPSERRETRPK